MALKKQKAHPPKSAALRVSPGRKPQAWGLSLPSVIEIKPRASRYFTPEPKLARIVDAVGLNVAADMLGVDRAQLSRNASGKSPISAAIASRISDVEYVLDRALKVMYPDEVGPWLTSPEPLLGGSIPMNVLVLLGPARVIDAIDARAAGAFA
ncbi:MAG: hypothetical protein ACYDGM_09725 [Vulcanimicrobiaceae bacterium]